MKLQTKIISMTLIIFIVAVLGLGFIIFSNFQINLEKQIEANLNSISQTTEKNIETFLDGQKSKIELVATQNELTNQELKKMSEMNSGFYDLFVIAPNGTVIASSNPDRIGLDRSNRSYFYSARNQTFIGSVYFALVPQKYSISVSTPFHGGVLVGAIDVDILGSLVYNKSGFGETGESLMAFVNENGEIVYFSERKFSSKKMVVLNKTQIVATPMYLALFEGGGFSKNLKDYRGVSVIGFANYIESAQIGLVTKLDSAEAYASIYTLRNKLLQILVGTIILIFILVYFLVSPISREISELSLDIDKITKGDLEIQLKKSNIFEIQVLIDSLNRILATMKLAILRTGLAKNDFGLGEVTKAKEEAETKSKESEEIYKVIIENSINPVFMIDKTNKYVSANAAMAKNVGKKLEGIIGNSIFNVFSKKTAEQISKNVKKVFNTGISLNLQEKVNVQGKEEKIITRLSPVKDKKGNVSFVVGMVINFDRGK